MEYLLLIVGAVLVNNVVLAQFLGICPFLGVSNKMSTSTGMSASVVFVMTLATLVTWMVYHFLLAPLGIEFMQTISYILIIASLVQMVEIILKKTSPALYQALGVFLPLITTNCVILGVALLVIQKDYDLITSTVYTIGTGLGYGLALIIFAGLREQLDLMSVPASFKGTPIALITAGILAMAFMGFAGMV